MAIYNVIASNDFSAGFWAAVIDPTATPVVVNDNLMTITNANGTETHLIGSGFSTGDPTQASVTGIQHVGVTSTSNILLEEITGINITGTDLANVGAFALNLISGAINQEISTALGSAWQNVQQFGVVVSATSDMVVFENSDGSQTRHHGTDLKIDSATGVFTAGSLIGVDHFDPLTNTTLNSYTYLYTIPIPPLPGAIFSSFAFAGNDTLNGGDGNDVLFGYDGNDTLNGGDGNDALNGGAGNDILNAGDGLNSLSGGAGDDTLNGGANQDGLFGGDGNDTLNGGNGTDLLQGGAGNDTLSGGQGGDIFNFIGDWGQDTISDYNAGVDVISFADLNAMGGSATGPSSFTDFTITEVSGNAVISYGANSITLTGVSAASLSATDFQFTANSTGGNITTNLNIDILSSAGGKLDWWEVINTAPSSMQIALMIGGATDTQITMENTDGTLTVINGTNMNLSTGQPVSITSLQHFASDGTTLLGTVTGIDYIFAPTGGNILAAGLAPLLAWANEFDFNSVPTVTDTSMTFTNLDGSSTIVYGTGFLGGDPALVTVTGAELNVGGTTVLDFSGVSLTLDQFGAFTSVTDMASLREVILSGDDNYNSADPDDVSINTQGGDDTILSGPGNDILNGGDGDDYMVGGAGNDIMDGGNGIDNIRGGVGSDSLSGGVGNDYLLGQDGNDTLSGGDGNDTLVGGAGYDSMDGGAGDDYFVMDIGDTIDGGADNDTAIVEGVISLSDTNFANMEAVKGSDNDDNINASAVTSSLNIQGEGGNDVLFGTNVGGNISGGNGNDYMVGGDGADIMNGDAGEDNMRGGNGNDFLYGGLNDDYMLGGDGNDNLRGGDGNDTLVGGVGYDSMDGGAGDDFFVMDDNDSINGGLGRDTAIVTGDITLDQTNFVNMEAIKGDASDNTIDASALLKFELNMQGGAGADTLIGTSFRDIMLGGSGEDNISGGDGNDYMRGGNENDIMNGGEGVDNIGGDDGADTLNGGDGGDYLTGGAGADILNGDAGDDFIRMDDLDTVDGGIGFDTAIVDGAITLNNTNFANMELIKGGDNDDNIDASNITGALNMQGNGGNDTLIGTSFGDIMLGGEGNNILSGGDGDDYMRTGSGTDILNGGNGVDNMGGGNGSDQLFGGAGNDYMKGEDGADILTGGLGNDNLIGGTGVDSFVFEDGWGQDFLHDFADDGLEKMDFSGTTNVNSLADLTITDVGNGNALVSDNAGNTITVIGIAAADLMSGDDFIF